MKIKTDKKLHAVAGLGIGFTAYFIAFDYVHTIPLSFMYGVLTATTIGILKEVFDKFFSKYFNKSHWSWLDIVATMAGGLVGSGIAIFMLKGLAG